MFRRSFTRVALPAQATGPSILVVPTLVASLVFWKVVHARFWRPLVVRSRLQQMLASLSQQPASPRILTACNPSRSHDAPECTLPFACCTGAHLVISCTISNHPRRFFRQVQSLLDASEVDARDAEQVKLLSAEQLRGLKGAYLNPMFKFDEREFDATIAELDAGTTGSVSEMGVLGRSASREGREERKEQQVCCCTCSWAMSQLPKGKTGFHAAHGLCIAHPRGC